MPSQISYENLLIFNILYFCYCYGGGEDEELGKKIVEITVQEQERQERGIFFFFNLQKFKILMKTGWCFILDLDWLTQRVSTSVNIVALSKTSEDANMCRENEGIFS